MSVSVYITNKSIQVLEGTTGKQKVAVKRGITAELPMDCIMDGVITDQVLFTEFLQGFWEEHHIPKKEVHLVFNSKIISTAKMEAPLTNKENIYDYVKREFHKHEDETEQIFGYLSITKNTNEKKSQILASKIERAELQMYLDVCAKLGIQLVSVESALSNAIYLLRKHPQVVHKTCIIQIGEQDNLINLLFLDGVYHYSNATRTYEEHGTVNYAIEVARSVSNILQFMKANELAYSNMQVYLTGFEQEDLSNCFESILQMNPNLDTAELDMGKMVTNSINYLFAAGGFVQAEKTGNLLLALQKIQKREKQKNPLKKAMMPLTVLTGMFFAVTVVLAVITIQAGIKLSQVRSYNQSVAELAEEYDVLQEKATFLENQYQAVEGLGNSIASYPVANKYVEQVVMATALGYANVQIDSFDAASGVLNLTATAENVENINEFIEHLSQQSIFVSVDYTGYVYQEDTAQWQINVVCYLAEHAGKEAQQ